MKNRGSRKNLRVSAKNFSTDHNKNLKAIVKNFCADQIEKTALFEMQSFCNL